RGTLITTLTSPNGGGWFGYSVAISGTNVVVGAPAENAGHAYVFTTTGTLITTFTSPNAQTGGEFGFVVDVSGTNVVIGTQGETAAGFSNAGHAYIYNTGG